MEARLAAGLYRIIADPYPPVGADMPLLIGTFAEYDADDIDDIVWALVDEGIIVERNGWFEVAPFWSLSDN